MAPGPWLFSALGALALEGAPAGLDPLAPGVGRGLADHHHVAQEAARKPGIAPLSATPSAAPLPDPGNFPTRRDWDVTRL